MNDIRLNASMCMQPKEIPPSAWIGHIPFAAWLVEELKPRTLVELGTHHGTSYLAFCQAVAENALGTNCFAVDTWHGDEHSGVYGEEVFTSLLSYHQATYAAFSQLLRMTFDEASACFEDGSVDLLHIDGLHTYQAAKHDFETWLPKMSDRGVILFHDTMVREREFGVWRLWAGVSQAYPSFEFTHAYGLGVLIVGKKAPDGVAALSRLADDDAAQRVRRLFERLSVAIHARAKVDACARDVEARDVQIEQLEKAIAGREDVGPLLHELIRQVDTQRREIDPVIQDQLQQITQLRAENQRALERLDQALPLIPELIRQIEVQRAGVQECEERIVDLNRAVADHATRVRQLNHDVSERNGLIASQNRRISSLNQAILVAEKTVRQMMDSRSWRLTRPLRAIRSALSGKSRPIQDRDALRFDPAWYLKTYPDVVASGMDSQEHYLSAGKNEGRQPAPSRFLQRQLKKLQLAKVFPKTMRRVGGIKLAINKAVSVARREGWFAPGIAPDFDETFYLLQYPDIAKSGRNPYRHYIEHGKTEGRLGVRPTLVIHEGSAGFDPSKETILVVNHEASRSGAPILGLNIVQRLQKKFNVVALLLGDGPLVGAFRQEVSRLVGPMRLRDVSLSATLVIDHLLESYPLKFAIVNSIESRVVLEALTRRAVPTVSLIHEFAAYTRPRHAFREAIFWAGETIFSTAITHENAISEFPDLADRSFNIVPQGLCSLSTEGRDEATRIREDARVLNTLRPDGPLDEKVVILGVGFVQQRKGVDLFIECASKVHQTDEGKRCRFVWIGKGYDPENDMGYSVYLADQLRRSGLDRQVTFMDETSSLEVAYNTADILLISSRLDPLPNVAIDAMAHGLPVICFDRTTGIADVLAEAGLSGSCVSPYLDTADMASKVLLLAGSESSRREIGNRLRQLVYERFGMDAYIDQLEGLAAAAGVQVVAESESAREIIESGVAQLDFFCLPQHRDMSLQEIIRFKYVRSWASGVGRRKLFPGFHPGIYRERHGVAEPFIDPLADYLRAGRPDGPWGHDLITSKQSAVALPPTARVALHLHIHYIDMLPEIVKRLELNAVRPDLFVSVTEASGVADIRKILKAYSGNVVDTRVVPNRGRDIGPLLTALGPQLVDHYDVVGHMHTKKSLDVKDETFGKSWHEFLLENLLGGKTRMADLILGRMRSDPSIGMVFPDDPNVIGWGNNLSHARKLGECLGIHDFPKNFVFPVGTMFWARVESIRPMFELQLDWCDYPAEPVPYDGSILHALERMFPFVVEAGGARCVLTNVAGVTR